MLLLTLKMGDLDIDGTIKLVAEIYGSLTKFGTKSFLLWNRVTGYCIPHRNDTTAKSTSSLLSDKQQTTKTNMKDFLTGKTEMKVITSIPCYCDIQFSTKEFLTVLEEPQHPFTKQFEQLVHELETI
jgi:chromosome partitioning protein